MAHKIINTIEELRQIYPEPSKLAIGKVMASIDSHSRDFIGASPFFVLATTGTGGRSDASPRGGVPGFVHVVDDKHLLLGDKPGNSRLDSYENILNHPQVGMLFMIPGISETLRINGKASITIDKELLANVANKAGRAPKAGLLIEVQEAFLHCAVSLTISKIWKTYTWPDERPVSTADTMWADHVEKADAEKANGETDIGEAGKK
ncbi:MAG: pyridoxamine 5'-phosphate oxidase family protein [Kordiimonadaceae bacterium]|nr:pyridoxamine 5'-phosphate oxidase family protein [Kordiimonadaceae bacterium]